MLKNRTRFLLVLLFALVSGRAALAGEETLRYGRFGTVYIYNGSATPAQVVLFVSGDGGWNKGVVDMARNLASLNALVVGVDIRAYLRELESAPDACAYPAADFEALSQFVQRKFGFAQYVAPVLVGYSSGATLVYATLVQAPPGTFRGALSLGFCPDLLLQKKMCRGSGLEWQPGPKGKGVSFLPTENLLDGWIALQGTTDQVCNPQATRAFVAKVTNGEIVMLERVGHGFAVPRNWMPQFKQAFLRLTQQLPSEPLAVSPDALKHIPLEEIPAADAGGKWLALWITGDGGWGATDRGVSAGLAARGVPVVALNSLHYFWKARTPEETAADLALVLRHYLAKWNKEKVVLIGYSFGADVLPFVASRLPPDLLPKVRLISFLGLSRKANFEVHPADWVMTLARKSDVPVQPELDKLKHLPMQCFFGEEDNETLCRNLPPGNMEVHSTRGGHRFGENFGWIVNAILARISAENSPAPGRPNQ